MRTSKVNWDEANQMVLDGYNFCEIAEKFGVTRQYIHAHYAGYYRGKGKKDVASDIVYPNLQAWFRANRMNFRKMAGILYGNKNQGFNVKRILIGKTVNLSMDMIKKMSELTGMTYEEMFEKGA